MTEREKNAAVAQQEVYDSEFADAIRGTPENALVMVADDYCVLRDFAAQCSNDGLEIMCRKRSDACHDEITRQYRAEERELQAATSK